MSFKSRWGFIVPVCCKYDCVNRDTEVCKDCIPRFDYRKAESEKKEKRNDDMREVPRQDLSKDQATL